MSGVEYLGSITCRNQAVAKKQLIGKELLFATEDWLATKKNLQVDEDPALQNSFNYTMYGMLIGASIGYFAGNLTIGFGIGMLAGGVVDSYLNSKKKKKREAILKAQAEKKQK